MVDAGTAVGGAEAAAESDGGGDAAATASEPASASTFDRILPALVSATYGVTVTLVYLVLATPHVRGLSELLTAAGAGFALSTVVLALRPGARGVAARWAIPLVAYTLGWPVVADTVTWSHPKRGLGVLLMEFLLLVVVDLVLLGVSLGALVRNWRVGVVGLLVIGLTWTVVLATPEATVRRLRVELAAPALVDEAKRLLDDPAQARETGPFIAHDASGDGRVVGWPIGPGFLGRGPGLIWDPEGVLDGDGFAQTEDGYPWFLYGNRCEPIVDEWLYCRMR